MRGRPHQPTDRGCWLASPRSVKVRVAAVCLREYTEYLEQYAQSRTEEVMAMHDFTLPAMASPAEPCDQGQETIVGSLSATRRRWPSSGVILPLPGISHPRLLLTFAPLHGTGKIGVPKHILLIGRLTLGEFEIMEFHATEA